MMRVKCIARRLDADEPKLETVEYAILAGLVIATTVVVIAAIGAWILSTLQMVLGAPG